MKLKQILIYLMEISDKEMSNEGKQRNFPTTTRKELGGLFVKCENSENSATKATQARQLFIFSHTSSRSRNYTIIRLPRVLNVYRFPSNVIITFNYLTTPGYDNYFLLSCTFSNEDHLLQVL
jgi:hypothetical protein